MEQMHPPGIMAQVPADIMGFYQRFQDLQVQRDKDDKLFADLWSYCRQVENSLRNENDQLKRELKDAHLDLEDARRSRRDLQLQLNMAQQRIEQSTSDCDSMRNRNPYIVALVDGDGMIFKEGLVCQGIEGGKQAANALRESILKQYGLADDIEVMVRVYANLTGLSKAMMRDGTLSSPEDLRDFTLGFTQGKASFDFIDVGHGKERADSKIKECMRWHLRNHNCRQILLGISHDAGYVPFLEDVVSQDDRNRIAVLEGPPTVRDLALTGLQIINFNNIFRAEKLITRAPSTSSDQGSVLITSLPPPNTWAGVTSIAPPVQSASPVLVKNGSPATITIKKATPTPPAKPLWIPEPRGLDAPISPNPAVLDKIKRRTANNKLCNNHYLRGPCAKGDECCFEHQYKPSEEELKAIAFLTRLNPCTNGQDCDSEFCIYGHHCPSYTFQANGKDPVCTQFGCRFGKEDHPPGTIIKHPRKERWESERYY